MDLLDNMWDGSFGIEVVEVELGPIVERVDVGASVAQPSAEVQRWLQWAFEGERAAKPVGRGRGPRQSHRGAARWRGHAQPRPWFFGSMLLLSLSAVWLA